MIKVDGQVEGFEGRKMIIERTRIKIELLSRRERFNTSESGKGCKAVDESVR